MGVESGQGVGVKLSKVVDNYPLEVASVVDVFVWMRASLRPEGQSRGELPEFAAEVAVDVGVVGGVAVLPREWVKACLLSSSQLRGGENEFQLCFARLLFVEDLAVGKGY